MMVMITPSELNSYYSTWYVSNWVRVTLLYLFFLKVPSNVKREPFCLLFKHHLSFILRALYSPVIVQEFLEQRFGFRKLECLPILLPNKYIGFKEP